MLSTAGSTLPLIDPISVRVAAVRPILRWTVWPALAWKGTGVPVADGEGLYPLGRDSQREGPEAGTAKLDAETALPIASGQSLLDGIAGRAVVEDHIGPRNGLAGSRILDCDCDGGDSRLGCWVIIPARSEDNQ